MDKVFKKSIIETIRSDLSDRFRVIDNTAKDKQLVAGQFPDVLLMRQIPPQNDDVLFVMRIENKDSNLVDSVAAWKDLERSDISFYLVVPDEKLDEAKRLASAVGVFAKFAHYTSKNNKVKVSYE